MVMSQSIIEEAIPKQAGTEVTLPLYTEPMRLQTLGGLKLENSSFTRPKPLLLLCYLALEGPQERRHLAELFWPKAADHMKSLTVALTQLRQGAPGTMEADDVRVEAKVETDVKAFLTQLEQHAFSQALELYQGPFLEGFYLKDWSEELEEWVYKTREFLAGRAREAHLNLAEQEATRGDFESATKRTEAAYRLRGAALPEPDDLQRLHTLLIAGHSAYASEVAEEAEVFGVQVMVSADEARSQLKARQQTTRDARLPTPSTPFIGRHKDIEAVKHLLLEELDCQLVTLLGPGGMGKTRLAIEVASQLETAFRQGVFFVDLTPVGSASGLPSAIAQALDFSFYSDVPAKEQLLNYLQGKDLLLVVDNFEHLLEGAELLTDIVQAAPEVRLLVTSRESLHLQEEWLYKVEGLSFPAETSDLGGGSSFDALTLFESHARRARVRFPLEAKEKELVRLCQLVEGMPLALELAASWLRVLPFESITAELSSGLDILTTRLQNVPERHQSMRAVLEGSWQLLKPQERSVLKRLSVFRGGFRREAAEVVAGASLLTLAALVEKSLLRATSTGRYQLHELLRQFAAEKLAEDAEEATVREKHSAYFLEVLSSQEENLTSRDQRQALDDIAEERDNIHLSWTEAINRNDDAAIDAALSSFYLFHKLRGYFQEGEGLFAYATTAWHSAGKPDILGKLLARRGEFCLLLGRYEAAKTYLESSLSLLNAVEEQAFVFTRLGELMHLQGDREASETYCQKAVSICRDRNDLSGLADALSSFSSMYGTFSDYSRAKACAEEALAISRQLGRPDMIADALGKLAWPVNCLGDYRDAEAYWRESLDLCEATGDRHGVAVGTNFLGWSLFCSGEKLEEAMRLYECALTLYREVGHRQHIAMCLGDMTLAAGELGDYESALSYGQEGEALATDIGHVDLACYNLYGLGAAACELGDFAASRRYLSESVTQSMKKQVPDHAVIALYHFANLLVAESSSQESEAAQAKLDAVGLLHFVLEHPVCWQPFKDRATKRLRELEANLPTQAFIKARIEAKDLTLEAIVERFFDTFLHP